MVNVFHWSKTKDADIAGRIYVADLFTGKVGAQSKSKDYIVWPVRYVEVAQ
jgi:hypothetical protein